MESFISVETEGKYFKLLKFPVTYGIWNQVCSDADIALFNRDREKKKPIYGVTFDQIMKFCSRLEIKQRELGALLDTEYIDIPNLTEWNLIAYNDFEKVKNRLEDYAWINTNSNDHVHEVACKQENDRGLYDLFGNTLEWCHDECETKFDYKINSTKLYPALGGAYDDSIEDCQLNQHRYISNLNQFNETVGFRIGIFDSKR